MNVNEKETQINIIKEIDAFEDQGHSSDIETNFLSTEQIEEFFNAVENGSIDRLEQLFNQNTNADPNMTRFTESLLMAAIRTNRLEVAEYLIDQLAINVQYEADLNEFHLHRKHPILYRKMSCRELAYNQGMMELVDLIDIISDDVTSNIKRYLINRLRTRLNIIHQTYLKRLEEHKTYLLFQSNQEKEKENQESPIENINDENNIIPSIMLPPITHRLYKSHIEETIENINRTNEKSIDETGKKTFRFSNYTLRFRLLETSNSNNKNKKQSQIPTLPTISLFRSPLPPLETTTNITHRTNSQASSRFSIQDSRTSICRSARRTTLPEIKPPENKTSIINTTKRIKKNKNNIKYGYIPQQQQQQTIYNQSQHFMPVTLKSTAIGLPSDTRIIRD